MHRQKRDERENNKNYGAAALLYISGGRRSSHLEWRVYSGWKYFL